MEYTTVIEKTPENCAVYVPDLPVCVAIGKTRDEAIREMRTAMAPHIDSLREHGEPVSVPQCSTEVVEVAV